MNNNNNWILNCSIEEFLKILSHYIGIFDDATQLTKDDKARDFINSSHNELDQLYHNVKNSGIVTPQELNSARMTIKDTFKMIVVLDIYNFESGALTIN